MSGRDILILKIEEYKSALERDPKSTLFVALSDAYRQSGQLDDSLEVALKGTWELPEFAAGYAAVGRVYAQRKVFAKSEAAFYRALSVDQTYIPAYKGLARVYREQGEIQKASDILTKAIMLEPDDTSLQQMIETIATTSNAVESGSVVNQEIVMEQSSAEMKSITTTTIAEIYIEQSLYDKALEVYRELLGKNPQDVSVQQKISELESLIKNGGAPAAAAEPVAVSAPAAVTASEPLVSSNTVIEKLNGWLNTIQARRNRV